MPADTTDIWTDPALLADQAAKRIAGHLRGLRATWPAMLGDMRQLHGLNGVGDLPAWPDWCYVPMAAVAARLQAGGSFSPSAIAEVSAIGQWRLLGRHIVTFSPEVAEDAVPGPTRDMADVDLLLPTGQLLNDLAAACYYLVMPTMAVNPDPDMVMLGCYVHLEYDAATGLPELRILADISGLGLVGVPVMLDQPTLAWSAAKLDAEIGRRLPAKTSRALADLNRLVAWWAWPLIGALLNHDTQLSHRGVLNGPGTDPNVKDAQVWQITYGAPPFGGRS